VERELLERETVSEKLKVCREKREHLAESRISVDWRTKKR
jgi:hypothetical protein